MSNYKFETLQLHVGQEQPDPATDARAVPIYATTSYVFRNSAHAAARFGLTDAGNIYGRLTNSTQDVFEKRIAALEGGVAALAVASGAAAINYTIQALAQQGDHIVAQKTIYGGSYNLLAHTLPQFGVTTTFVNAHDLAEVENAIQDNTKMIYFETPANPTLHVTDIAALAALKAGHPGIRIVVDNTFAPPPVQYPLKLGADVVVHSVTKYINGHGDVIGGVVVGSKEDICVIRGRAMGKITGTPLTPFCAYLIIRGMKTLGMRVRQHCANAMAIAQYLETSPCIEKVYYPGLESMGKDHEVAKKQMNGLYGAMISFVLKDGIKGMSAFDASKKLMDNLKIPAIAVSLGDPDTLIQHPASMTHVRVPKEVREEVGITDGMLRFSVGLENVEDLIADFDQAFAAL